MVGVFDPNIPIKRLISTRLRLYCKVFFTSPKRLLRRNKSTEHGLISKDKQRPGRFFAISGLMRYAAVFIIALLIGAWGYKTSLFS